MVAENSKKGMQKLCQYRTVSTLYCAPTSDHIPRQDEHIAPTSPHTTHHNIRTNNVRLN
jgi:hypothetical protein